MNRTTATQRHNARQDKVWARAMAAKKSAEAGYRYENIAELLPPVSQIKEPRKGDRATISGGNVIVVFRDGDWKYL